VRVLCVVLCAGRLPPCTCQSLLTRAPPSPVQVASWSFTFPVEGRPVAKGDLAPLRAVMCVEARKAGQAAEVLDAVVGNMRAGGGAGGEGTAGAPSKGGK
jgi:hypothetical protein